MNAEQIKQLVNKFYEDGVVVIPSVLKPEYCDELKRDIDKVAQKEGVGTRNSYIYKRMFEHSEAHMLLFDQEPVVTFAEQVIDDQNCKIENENFTSTSLQCHVIHNNAIIVPARAKGISSWHQDDPPHYIVKNGETPKNVHIPVLVFTVNYYLTDVSRIENGPTAAIKGSHLFGKPCPADPTKDHDVYHCTAPMGSAVVFNSQVWHRGSPNLSANDRYVSQVTYARRIVGHKYSPFMNYQMPEHVVNYAKLSDRTKRLFGFFGNGAYG